MPKFLRFTDRDGQRWRVYEFSVLAGRIIYGAPGRRGSQYRGFAPDPADARPRRRYMMLPAIKPEDSTLDQATLQLQLELSLVDWRDDPTHPANRTNPNARP